MQLDGGSAAHQGLIRSVDIVGDSIVTAGEDARLCLWSLSDAGRAPPATPPMPQQAAAAAGLKHATEEHPRHHHHQHNKQKQHRGGGGARFTPY